MLPCLARKVLAVTLSILMVLAGVASAAIAQSGGAVLSGEHGWFFTFDRPTGALHRVNSADGAVDSLAVFAFPIESSGDADLAASPSAVFVLRTMPGLGFVYLGVFDCRTGATTVVGPITVNAKFIRHSEAAVWVNDSLIIFYSDPLVETQGSSHAVGRLNLATGTVAPICDLLQVPGFPEPDVDAAGVSPSGVILLLDVQVPGAPGGFPNTIRCYAFDVATCTVSHQWTLTGYQPYNDLAFTRNGSLWASADNDRLVELNTLTGAPLATTSTPQSLTLSGLAYSGPSDPAGIAALPSAVLPLRVSPNPARGGVWLSATGQKYEQWEVFDAAGRLVRSETLPKGEASWQWDGRDRAGRAVAPGTYWVRASGPQARAASRLVLIH